MHSDQILIKMFHLLGRLEIYPCPAECPAAWFQFLLGRLEMNIKNLNKQDLVVSIPLR